MEKVDLFDACALVVLNDLNDRCVVIRVACEGRWVGNRGGFGPSTLGTGHRMDNREPQSCF